MILDIKSILIRELKRFYLSFEDPKFFKMICISYYIIKKIIIYLFVRYFYQIKIIYFLNNFI